MLRVAIYLIFAISALLAIMFFRVATVSSDPAEWHVDPLNFERPATPNTYLVATSSLTNQIPDREAPVYSANPTLMAKAFDDFVLAQNSVTRIAGEPESGWFTYVQRTPTLRFPDYISVKFIDLTEGRSTIAIYSRSRYGQGDLGVNKARVEAWLATLSSFEE